MRSIIERTSSPGPRSIYRPRSMFRKETMSKIDELYDTIGGNRTVWAAIDSFYRRVLEDPELRPFFKSTDMAHLKAGQTMFIAMLLGGRTVYTGREIGAAHAEARMQGLTDIHFDQFLKHFQEALDEVGVHPDKAAKAMKLLESQRGAVLHPKSASHSAPDC